VSSKTGWALLARVVLPLAAAALCLNAAPSRVADEKELTRVIEQYFEADGRTMDGRAARRALLEEVDGLSPEPLTSAEVKKWSGVIEERWMDGRKLEKKTGSHRYWEKEKRGLYIVDGITRKPKGLLIGMHGGGVGSGDAREAAGFLGSAAKKLKWVAIFPEVLEKTEHGWTTSGTEEWVIDLVDAARRTYGVDANQVVFAGHSMGGFGSWMLGAHHADRVACLGPAAGAPTPYLDQNGLPEDIIEGVIPNLRNVPMRVYQSDDDPQVPAAANRIAVKKIAEAREKWGGYEDFEYIEDKGKGHAYPPGGGKKWLAALKKYERDPHPKKVVWQPTLTWKLQFYWLYWETPQLRRIVEAEIDSKANTVAVTSEYETQGLWILLPDDLLKLDKEVVVTARGEEVWRGVPERRLSTLLMTGVRGDEGLTFSARVPAWKRN